MAGQTPLAGRRILVTRRPEQAGTLSQRLAALGATVVEVPAIEVAPPADTTALDGALSRLHRYHWVLVASANAVRFLRERLDALGLDPAAVLAGVRVGVVGPATAAAWRERVPGVPVALAPGSDFRAKGLLAALGDVAGQAILIPASERARDLLPDTLRSRGALVDLVTAYRTVAPAGLAERLAAELQQGLDLATFASPSAVEGFVTAAGTLAGSVPAAVIGPVTEQAARAAGLDVRAVAVPSTAEGLVAAVLRLLGPDRAGVVPTAPSP